MECASGRMEWVMLGMLLKTGVFKGLSHSQEPYSSKGQPTIPYLDPVVIELVDIQRMFTKGQ